MHESNDVTREVLHQRPSIFRRVQKFLFGPYQPGERADGASPLSLTTTDYCSTRLAHLTVDLFEVPLKSFDPLCRSERAGVRAGAYDVRRVWGGRATWIPTSYDHALGKVDPLGKVKFGAS